MIAGSELNVSVAFVDVTLLTVAVTELTPVSAKVIDVSVPLEGSNWGKTRRVLPVPGIG